jgi:hypothetical protein
MGMELTVLEPLEADIPEFPRGVGGGEVPSLFLSFRVIGGLE